MVARAFDTAYFKLLIVLLPLTHAFAISTLWTPSFLMLSIGLIIFIKPKWRLPVYHPYPLILMIALYAFIISGSTGNPLQSRSVAYWAIVFLSFGVVLENVALSDNDLLSAIRRAALFSSAFVALSVIFRITNGLDLENLIPRYSRQTLGVSTFGGALILQRSRGFFEEPGFLGMFTNAVAPFLILDARRNHWKFSNIIPLFLIGATYIFAFSAATFFIASVVSLSVLLLRLNRITTLLFLMFLACLFAGVFFSFRTIVTQFGGALSYKVLLESVPGRISVTIEAIRQVFRSDLREIIFGHGTQDGLATLAEPIRFMSQYGLIGLSMLLAFFVSVWICGSKKSTDYMHAFRASFLMIMLHTLVVPNLYYPFVWFLFAWLIRPSNETMPSRRKL